MAVYLPSGRRGGNRVLNRAFAAGVALVTGVGILTAVFVAKIADSSAAGHPASSVRNENEPGDDSGGGVQVTVPQQNQPPIGGSNGS